MIKRNNILRTLETNTSKLKSLGVRRIGVFGSFARGSSTRRSDVDILVEFDPKHKTFDNYMELKSLLEHLLRRKVDLVTRKALKPGMRAAILKETQYAGL